jgi:hypothetical protein
MICRYSRNRTLRSPRSLQCRSLYSHHSRGSLRHHSRGSLQRLDSRHRRLYSLRSLRL